jgi:thioredoxin
MSDGRAAGLPRSFLELVRTSDLPVLADFWAAWCGPCRLVTPSIERIARESAGRLLTVKVNVDRSPEPARLLEVQGIPTIMLFWKGEPRMRLTGAYPYEEILRAIAENWPRGAGSAPGAAAS